MDGACSMYVRKERYIRVLVGDLRKGATWKT